MGDVQRGREPEVAIIIPVHGHPMLATEALHSALAQQADFGIHVIVVNDGCPHPETNQILTAFSITYPDRLTYLRKANGGLSSARNAGIRHVLGAMPSVRAVFMLDADNRLRTGAMARAFSMLQAHPEAGWVYPSIDMFGIPARCDYGGPYSRLIHSEMNVSEAGSLIRREVFEAGVLFDESFKQGFEDWHFFLTAGDAGFSGINCEDFGFLYRKRPESMLAEADRLRDKLVAELREAHSELYNPAHQLKLEHEEAPRFAIWFQNHNEVHLVTDPTLPGEILTHAEFVERWWHSCSAPTRVRVPPYLVVIRKEIKEALMRARALHWALWQLELAADDGMAFASLSHPPRKGEIAKYATLGASERGPAAIWMVSTQALMALLKADHPMDPENPGDTLPAPKAIALRLELDGIVRSVNSATGHLREALGMLHGSEFRAAGRRRWRWRQPSVGWRGKEHRILRKSFGGQPPFPRVPLAGSEIGVVVTSVGSPDLSRLIDSFQTARAQGARLTLFSLGESTGAGATSLKDRVDAFAVLGGTDFAGNGRAKAQFHGAELPAPTQKSADDRALALLLGLTEIHVLNCPEAMRLMGALRRQGGKTVLHLQSASSAELLDLTLAFEHAHDQVVVPDRRTEALLVAHGLPMSKLRLAGESS